MRDPYEVLGIPRTADAAQIKSAYRKLAKKYHPDNYVDSPLADVANEKMAELNEAYDEIMNSLEQHTQTQSSSYYREYSNSGQTSQGANYAQVRVLINRNRLDEAEQILESFPQETRDAQWYYLKGQINYNRGWVDQAYTYFTTAHNLDPNNVEYRHIYENLRDQRNGGFRTSRESSSHDVCDICAGLYCADCCCESLGGDLIPCC